MTSEKGKASLSTMISQEPGMELPLMLEFLKALPYKFMQDGKLKWVSLKTHYPKISDKCENCPSDLVYVFLNYIFFIKSAFKTGKE